METPHPCTKKVFCAVLTLNYVIYLTWMIKFAKI